MDSSLNSAWPSRLIAILGSSLKAYSGPNSISFLNLFPRVLVDMLCLHSNCSSQFWIVIQVCQAVGLCGASMVSREGIMAKSRKLMMDTESLEDSQYQEPVGDDPMCTFCNMAVSYMKASSPHLYCYLSDWTISTRDAFELKMNRCVSSGRWKSKSLAWIETTVIQVQHKLHIVTKLDVKAILRRKDANWIIRGLQIMLPPPLI